MKSTKKLADRFNEGKLPWFDMPLFLFRPVMRVSEYGAKKYSAFNYLKGGPQSQYINSAMRHIDAHCDHTQSDIDQESGCYHLAHAAWNLMVATYMLINRPELDDRYKGEEDE